MSNCKYHSDKPAVNTCCKCGDWICDDCAVEINGRVYCKSCLSRCTSEFDGTSSHSHKVTSSNNPSSFFVFCLSFIPGAGHMYEGLMKRGLMIMSSFFALGYLSGTVSGIFTSVCFILWIWNFFDAFECRKKIISGIHVNDDFNDIKSFVIQNKVFIIGFLGIVFAVEILDYLRMSMDFFIEPYHHIISNGLVFVFIALGIYIIFFKDKNSTKKKDDDKQ